MHKNILVSRIPLSPPLHSPILLGSHHPPPPSSHPQPPLLFTPHPRCSKPGETTVSNVRFPEQKLRTNESVCLEGDMREVIQGEDETGVGGVTVRASHGGCVCLFPEGSHISTGPVTLPGLSSVLSSPPFPVLTFSHSHPLPTFLSSSLHFPSLSRGGQVQCRPSSSLPSSSSSPPPPPPSLLPPSASPPTTPTSLPPPPS